MRKVVDITAENVDLCERVAAVLANRLEELAAMTRQYPVELEFGGYRFVFANRDEITTLQRELRELVVAFRRNQAA